MSNPLGIDEDLYELMMSRAADHLTKRQMKRMLLEAALCVQLHTLMLQKTASSFVDASLKASRSMGVEC